MSNLSPRALFLGSIFVTAVIAAAGIVFAVFPLTNDVSLISSDIKNKKTAVQTLEERREQKVQLNDSYELIKQDVARIKDQFIDRDALILFIQDTEKLALPAGVSLQITSASQAQPSRGAKAAPGLSSERFLLTAMGGFSGLMKFLEAFENSRYFNKVDEIRVRKLENYQLSQTPGLSAGDVEGLINIQVFAR